ncbi:helix-turn-helix transcriptional regulator [uncultured Jatrophihabitans sp.]|uniref:helix-turn-helix transcriptional regulator n=1 Tax=uncultured Jatrophihabitans sp. TaxID=1610747 RepID=UPI0035C9E3BC
MRASRLLSIMLTLSVRGRVSATELADELEVSVRTIYRDVEALGAAGVPVYATRGRHGGISLLDGYRTRLTGLSPDEADALLLSGVPGAAADLGLGPVLAASQLKVMAALPAELRERAARIRDCFHLDAPGWLRESEAPESLAALAEAAWTTHRVDVRYERSNRAVVERTLDPLGLVLKAGVWYLVARPGDAAPRTYRVSRVLAAHPRADLFTRPDGFDLGSFWAAYQRDYTERIFRDEAWVRLSPDGVRLLFLVGPAAARRARPTFSEPDADGWVEARVPVESVRHGVHALLQLGAEAEVLGPPALRSAVADEARGLAARYSDA